jgi:prephenate dehydratase
MLSTTSRPAKTTQTAAAGKGKAAGSRLIAYQGEAGANSHIACSEVFPELEPMPCPTFEDALGAVKSGEARYAMIPIENSVAGRVADIHHLLPNAGLYIIGEHFLPIRFQLMAPKERNRHRDVYSHVHASAMRRIIKPGRRTSPAIPRRRPPDRRMDENKARLPPTGGSAQTHIIPRTSRTRRTTPPLRHLSADSTTPEPGDGQFVTRSFGCATFQPRSQGDGRLMTNGVNTTKLESGSTAASPRRYSSPYQPSADRNVRLAMEELSFFSTELKVLGTYPASLFWHERAARRGRQRRPQPPAGALKRRRMRLIRTVEQVRRVGAGALVSSEAPTPQLVSSCRPRGG